VVALSRCRKSVGPGDGRHPGGRLVLIVAALCLLAMAAGSDRAGWLFSAEPGDLRQARLPCWTGVSGDAVAAAAADLHPVPRSGVRGAPAPPVEPRVTLLLTNRPAAPEVLLKVEGRLPVSFARPELVIGPAAGERIVIAAGGDYPAVVRVVAVAGVAAPLPGTELTVPPGERRILSITWSQVPLDISPVFDSSEESRGEKREAETASPAGMPGSLRLEKGKAE